MVRGLAYRVLTPRLCLRSWAPSDAPRLVESVAASLEHIRAWLLWGKNEPQTVEEKAQLLRTFRSNFDGGVDFIYAAFDREEQTVIGGTGLAPRVYEGGVEIGYWVDVRHLRQGYASEMTAALTRVAFEIEQLDRVEVHVDSRNVASAGVPAKLGFRHVATLPRSIKSPAGVGDRMIWMMLREDFRPTVPIEAYDSIGRRL